MPNGDVMTTCRSTDDILIIDKRTGDIRWRWGKGILAHPHNPTLLENGNILVYDNGNHRRLHPLDYSRVVEVNPSTRKIEWEYKAKSLDDFYSSIVSSAQRLPNGNTLICEGHPGRVFEVTREGEMVWEFTNPFYYPHEMFGPSNQIFRAYRYGPDFPGLRGKVLDPDRFQWTVWDKRQRAGGSAGADGSDSVEWCGGGEKQ
jgi:hypothetical protein